MLGHRFKKHTLASVFLISALFAVIGILSVFKFLPEEWLMQAAASIAAVVIAGLFVMFAYYLGEHMITPEKPYQFSPLRLAIGIALAFAFVSFFELL